MPDTLPRPERPTTTAPDGTPDGTPAAAADAARLAHLGHPADPWRPVQPADLDGLLQPYGDPARPVRPGEAVGRVLDGTAFPVSDDRRAPLVIDLVTGELVSRELGVLERAPRASAAGQADPDGRHTLALRPLVTVSPDRLSVLADVHSTDHRNRPLGADVYAAAVQRLGVAAAADTGLLAGPALDDALRDAARMGPRTGVVLARGMPPVHGEDARLEFQTGPGAACVLRQGEGRIDCSDRWPHCTVETGDPVVRVHPPTPGMPGVDVFGDLVPQRHGAPLELLPGPGMQRLEEVGGAVLFIATAPGLVDVADGAVTVSPLKIIDGDVDLSTGDVTVSVGSVVVRGTVRSGVTLTVERHVLVEEAVENARVRCGGDLMVRGGIVMGRAGREAVGNVAGTPGGGQAGQNEDDAPPPPPGMRAAALSPSAAASSSSSVAGASAASGATGASGAGSSATTSASAAAAAPGPAQPAGAPLPTEPDAGIEAGGNVVAAHAAFALVTAGGDVVIPSGVTGSRITAGGRFLAPGRGVVIGSAIRTGGGIDVGEAGSVAEVATRLMVQPDTTHLNALLRERDTITNRMARISAELPGGPDMAVLLQTPEEDRTLVEVLLGMRREMDERQRALGQDIAQARKRHSAELAASPVIIRRRTHGGVRVQFGGRGHDAIPAETGVQYVWRAAAHRVAVEPAPATPTERLFPPRPVSGARPGPAWSAGTPSGGPASGGPPPAGTPSA